MNEFIKSAEREIAQYDLIYKSLIKVDRSSKTVNDEFYERLNELNNKIKMLQDILIDNLRCNDESDYYTPEEEDRIDELILLCDLIMCHISLEQQGIIDEFYNNF